MKPKSRILSLLLAICLVAGLMPTAALAAGTDTGKAIQLVDSGTAANIGGGQADNIYFGTYQQSSDGSGGYNTDPIKWRVLENADGQLFLLSDQNLDVFQYHTEYESVTWETSTMRSWLNGYGASENIGGDSGTDYTSDHFIGTAFSEKEQKAIADTTVVNDDNPDHNTEGGNDTTDQIFLLSIEEVQNADYGFTDDSSRIATNTAYVAGGGKIGGNMLHGVGEADYWWLRSPGDNDNLATGVSVDGGVGGYSYSVRIAYLAVRPAFNLDLTSVLFTSAAAGGKSASGMDSGLTAVDDYTGSEWKLTLLDETREFAVTEQTVSGKPGDTITLNYTGATTGTNEYISVIIADENGAQYYGRVAQPGGESGTATLSIPADLAPGSYTLNVFSEQYNGDYKTDYASAFAEVALTVEEAAAPGIDTGKAIQLVDSGTAANIGGGQADNIYFGTYQQSSDGNSGYNIDPIKWRVLENANGQLFLLSDQNLDVFQYHVDYESVTWATSTMRSWLNGYGASHNTGDSGGIDYTDDNFINTAFSEKEQKAIAETEVVNDDNPTHGTEGGNNTTDQIFLLSIAEAQNSSYFADNSSRIATNTAYVAGGGKIGSSYMNGVGEAGYWWLRSPGDLDHRAAGVSVDGGVGSYGFYVSFDSIAVRPAFNLDLTSVLFTSAAAGGKSASGMDSGLTAIGNYDGNEWKLTLLDEARNFSISNAAIEGSTVTFSYSNAKTGENEYISAVIENNGEITHYGRILQPRSTSGTASFTIPDGVTLSDTVKLYVFNEQYNSDKMTDYASQLKEISRPTVDTTAPKLSNGSATRDSATTATVKFTSSEAGTCYYIAQDTEITLTKEQIAAQGTQQACEVGENEIKLDNISASAQYVAVVAQDALGNISDVLKFEIPAYIAPVYAISADTQLLDFGTVTEGYTQAPAAKTVTITNTGNQDVTVDLPTSTNYIITAGEGFTNDTATLAPNGTAAFTVQPKTGLGAGDYSKTLTISGSGNASVQVALSFTVNTGGTSGGSTGGSTTDYYRLTFDVNGGSEIASILRAEYTTVDLSDYKPTREGYEFTGWYADKDLTDKITSIRLTRNTTVYAGWEEKKETPGTGFENPFTDVHPDDWFYDDVMFVFANDLMVGTGDATFSPEISTSRAMIAVTLCRMEGEPEPKGANPYPDVENGAWYTEAITWANENGIAEGYGNGCFQPETPVTREQLAAFFYRYAAYKGYDITITGSLDHFNDKDNVSEWAKDTMAWAVGYGMIGGKDNNMLDPQGEATRAEFAAMLQRFCQKG